VIDSLNPTHTITFPAVPAGTIDTVEYQMNFEMSGVSGSVNTGLVLTGFGGSYRFFKIGFPNVYTPNGSHGNASTTVTIFRESGFGSGTMKLFNCVRVITLTPAEDTNVIATGTSTSKTGAVTQHSSVPGVGGSAEKNTSTIVDFIDITSDVAGDWAWFTNREVQVKYNGTSDGRTAFIIHVAFEIEYARRRLKYTDNVTADVKGVKDDGSGTISGVADGLLERPDHVFKWSLFNLLSLTAQDINLASFIQSGTDFQGAVAGGYKLAGIIQSKAEIKTIWRDWEKNCRAYFFWDLGKAKIQFRPLNSISLPFTADKTIPANMIRLDSNGRSSIQVERTPNRNIVNTIDLHYQRDWSSKDFDSIENGSDSDSITRYGRREKPDDFEFNWTRVQAQAIDLLAFFLAQYREPSDVLNMELFLDNIEVERGDILSISPPTHEDSGLPALVLGAGRQIGSGQRRQMDSIPVTLQLMRVN
jgi:hypothetical protein